MPADLSFLRSPKVIVGAVLVAVLLTAAACSSIGDDDDDCDSLGPTDSVFAAGSSGVRMAPPTSEVGDAVVPANGGFGTHLASCGG